MQRIDYILRPELQPYVNCIMTSTCRDIDSHTNIPLYADGYPGIMFQKTNHGFYLLPRKKKLSELFLYGQTIEPVSLDVHGPYQFIVFQLYPFASKYLLDIDPKELNDDCYDLFNLDNIDVALYNKRLNETLDLDKQIEIISELVLNLIEVHTTKKNDIVQNALKIILNYKGHIKINKLLSLLNTTERTLERHFNSHVGLTPKQFAKIIQFQYSLTELTNKKMKTLTDISFDSGFSDQSHFIRVFKKYTNQTPSYYLKAINQN
jgi:AraC-like DNA-binding protein